MGEHIQCGDLLDELSEYLDGQAREEVCAAIEAHMLDCPDCRIMVDTLRKTIHLYREQESQLGMPDDVRKRLLITLDLQDWVG